MRNIPFVFFAAFVFLQFIPPQQVAAEDVAEVAVNKAKIELEAKNFSNCEKICTDAIQVITSDKKIRLDEEIGPVYFLRGLARINLQKPEQAITDFRKAVTLMPDNRRALNEAAWTCATSKNEKVLDATYAVECAEKAVKLMEAERTGSNREDFGFAFMTNPTMVSDLYDTLAAAYAAAGDFKKAIAGQKAVLSLVENPMVLAVVKEVKSEDEMKEFESTIAAYRKRLDLYRNGKPFRTDR